MNIRADLFHESHPDAFEVVTMNQEPKVTEHGVSFEGRMHTWREIRMIMRTLKSETVRIKIAHGRSADTFFDFLFGVLNNIEGDAIESAQ